MRPALADSAARAMRRLVAPWRRGVRACASSARVGSVGGGGVVTHPAWVVLRRGPVAEHGVVATLYAHARSGAELLSLEPAAPAAGVTPAAASDEEKVFAVAFKTPVADDRGLPHVLEHSVLCGSEKFPVREPFVELMKGR